MNQIIHFKGLDLRIDGTPGRPEFLGQHACGILGLKNVHMALRAIPAHHKVSRNVATPGGVQSMLFVTLPGLFRLIFTSRKPEARAFQDWVYDRVLPALFTHGYFVTERDDHPPDLLALPDARREQIQLWIAIMQEIAAEEMPHQKIQEIAARYPNTRSFSVPSLYRRFNAWRDSNGDWKSQRPYRAP